MTKVKKENGFNELLLLNTKQELKNWLISNGKSPKTKSPIQFNMIQNEEEKEEISREQK